MRQMLSKEIVAAAGPFVRRAVLAVSLASLAMPAMGQERRYGPWRPGGDGDDMAAVISELQEMVAAARRDAAASPDFIADLEALIERYEQQNTPAPEPAAARPPVEPAAEADPEPREPGTVVSDTFADGNFDADPEWEVLQGDWEIDDEGRLRSITTAQEGSDAIGFAAIELPTELPNRFTMDWVVTDLGQAGQIEARLYQTSSRDPGYRLVLVSGAAPSVTLFRSSRSGVSQLETAEIANAPAGEPIRIVWARNDADVLTVEVNGEALLEVEDGIFHDPWSGLLLGNFGGDFAVEEVTVSAF